MTLFGKMLPYLCIVERKSTMLFCKLKTDQICQPQNSSFSVTAFPRNSPPTATSPKRQPASPAASPATPSPSSPNSAWKWPKGINIFTFIWIIVYKFIPLHHSSMKRYKVKQVIDLLLADGWVLDRTRGDHRQYVNREKHRTVTVKGKMSDDLSQFLLNSIWKQAGWK